jgi:3-deoxy-manno-octulosonate cytidylyltransferase (CMP-KDO synthetase)
MGMVGDKKFWVFIPARRHSKRFPNKMMANLGRKPLVMHVFDRVADVLKSKDRVWILVDDVVNHEALKLRTSNVLMTDKTCRNGTERCLDGAKRLSVPEDEVILNVQGDEPFISEGQLNALKKPFELHSTINNLVSTVACPIQHSGELTEPNRVKVEMNSEGIATGFFREIPERQKRVLYKHIGMYGYQRSTLEKYLNCPITDAEMTLGLEQLRMMAHDFPIYCTVCSDQSLSVDTPDDLSVAEKIYKALASENKTSNLETTH